MDLDFEQYEKLVEEENRRKREQEKKQQYEETQNNTRHHHNADQDKKEKKKDKKKHKQKRSRSRSQHEKKKKHHNHKSKIEEEAPKQSMDNQVTEVERQREVARKKKIEIIRAEVRDLERKIAEMEREIDEARRQDLTVLMYSLPLKAKEKHIYHFFQVYQCGKIRDIRIIRDQKSGRSRGVAYVEFYKDESIPLALALNDRLFMMEGKEMIGQPVKIQMSQAEKNRIAKEQKQMQARQARLQAQTQDLDRITGPARIQITGLVEQMTDFNENEIRAAFEPFGEIKAVEIPRDEYGRNNGMAYVTFAKGQAAKDAIETINENFQLSGKRIKVQVVNSGIFDLNMEIDDDFLNNPSMRLTLMQKLMKDDSMDSLNLPPLMSQLGITIQKITQGIQSTNPASGCISGWKPFSHVVPQCPIATKCVVLGNMWTHEEIQKQSHLIELKETVENECKKYGDIEMVWVDQKVEGNILVLFKQESVAIQVKTIMNLRKFGDKTILSFFITEQQFFNVIK